MMHTNVLLFDWLTPSGSCALKVTVISTSPNKKEEALSVRGADHFLVSKDDEAMKAAAGTLDGIIDTVSGGGASLFG